MSRVLLPLVAAVAFGGLTGCDYIKGRKSEPPQDATTTVTNVPPPPPPGAAVPAPVAGVQAPPAVASSPLRPAGTTLESPDAQNVALLYYSFAPPAPINEWVDADVRASGANEFERGPQHETRLAQFRRLGDEASAVGRVVLRVNAQLSEYDEQAGKYYLDLFGSGSTMGWDYRNKHFGIDFANREDAQGWALAPAAAAEVLARNRNSRDVVVTVTPDIVGHHARGDGGVLDGRVLSYVVDGRWNDVRLGKTIVVASPKP